MPILNAIDARAETARRAVSAGALGFARGRIGTAARALAVGVAMIAAACVPADDAELVPRSTMFIGVDVSGSFQKGGRYDDALAFAAHYIHAHLNGLGELEQPRALFVASIGGEVPGQPQSFHPIHDFEGKGVPEIEADMRAWFPPNDIYTDFSSFFRRAAALVKRQNLSLAPVTLVLLTDGVPDVGGGAARPANEAERYARIDMDALEYLARNVTVRVLYPDPTVAVRWERDVPRNRVRMWTVDAKVMEGWREQLRTTDSSPARADILPDAGRGEVAGQPDLWRWIRDNVDFRVRRTVL
ncbi:MAG TPA: hypothetical protein VMM83_04925 [Longimicrobiales bacterium]|nr:hypothetical protein [Longimicrobiales bacterium]